MFGKEVHSRIYFITLACLAASLPLSVYTTSLFQLVLLGNWLLEGRYVEKWLMFRSRRSIWMIVSIYLLFLIGLLYTSDYSYAFHDLRIKLPMLGLVILMGTTPPVSQSQLKWILLALAAGVVIGSLASISALFGIIDVDFKDMREISLFVSHIRFSLLINVAIFSLIYMVFKREYSPRSWEPPVYTGIMIWLVIFLFILQSITGIFIFLFVSFLIFWIYLHRVWSVVLRWTLAVIMLAALVMGMSLLTKSLGRFYNVKHFDPETIEQTTTGGRPYTHDFSSPFLENGNYIWLYLCEPEMKQEWNRVSEIDYMGTDAQGNDIRFTLIRYLTSLGLRKDSVGVGVLSSEDIDCIEQGKANYLYGRKWSFYAKVYEIIWQVDVYRKGGNPSGHSVTQRILYFEAASAIFKEHLWFGVGTGDVVSHYEEYYESMGSPLTMPWRLRAHNQFLTFLLTFGIIGFVWIMISFLYPIFLEGKNRDYLIWMFILIVLLSWLNEDTLETHTGVSFFAFFYALFLLATVPRKD
ncbi:MAG TPA: O-antigen ligase domain-containing protein [Bacteroides sp.]|nr:O-antigen ligase domain-containing protein [Bacteroides sp.]